MIRIIVMCFLSFSFSQVQAKWDNPSEKYSKAYSEYENTQCPIVQNNIKHFVYFARDRAAIKKHVFLKKDVFQGAQIMYPWALLEPKKGVYDFSQIESDLKYLKAFEKGLFIQIQDATFSRKFKGVPKYLLSEEYEGGVEKQLAENGDHEGWVAKRWNAKVQSRFHLLLKELGKTFDGRVEGINLQETAIGVQASEANGFSDSKYFEAIKSNMQALKNSFESSSKIQYANFMPGEWLPWEDMGYLRGVYKYGQEIGVGLGAPDLMPRRKPQLNHALSMMHENEFNVPISIAVQDGNYIGETNSNVIKKSRKNLVPGLAHFAKDFLKVDYIFWSNQKPYFKSDVVTCFQ